MTFKEWWTSCVRPYIEKGSTLERTILPWVADAFEAGVISQQDVEVTRTIPDRRHLLRAIEEFLDCCDQHKNPPGV